MAYQQTFKRYELKYILTLEQKYRIINAIDKYMRIDKYGKINIMNIYYDTLSYRLIRKSIEKPFYKEKIRIRKYGNTNDWVFVELKKKYNSIVYKRRLLTKESLAFAWLNDEKHDCSSQIEREIDYFIKYYGKLKPAVFISYNREAYYSIDESDFRITFDNDIMARTECLKFVNDESDVRILEEDKVLMEIKCSQGIPIWLVKVLSEEKIYKSSFSKYGEAYKNIIFAKLKEEHRNA